EKAAECYRKAIDLNPKDIKAVINLGAIYSRKGEYEKAIGLYRTAASQNPESFTAHHNLANAYRESKQYAPAIEEYKTALRIKPGDAQTLFFLGIAYRDSGNYADAALSFEKSLAADGSLYDAHEELGMIYYRKIKNKEKALQHFEKLLSVKPNHPRASEIRNIISALKNN
ncbi:MAG TPA: tetratricopeptide repeat protein, partial [Spirochaetota bacterium]|nr:tetratricopeptide repeat protein [Spirochaetota bacterium]